MGENEQQGESSEQQSGPPAVRASSEPARVDPEQLRQFEQFQQFQRFQEFQRQQGAQAPPPVPWAPQQQPARPPVWQRVLRSKAFRKLVLLLIVAIGLYWAYQHYFGSGDDSLPASKTGGGKTSTTVLLEKTPKATVRKVYHHIAQNEPGFACGQFEDSAARQFAADFIANSCEEAVGKLHDQIDKTEPRWRDKYAEPFPVGELGEIPDGDIVVSSCTLDVSPRLGSFTVHKIDLDQWIITDHRKESCPATAPSTR